MKMINKENNETHISIFNWGAIRKIWYAERWLAKVGYERIQENKLINNKKKTIKIALMVKHKVSTNFNFNRDNNYINFSVYTNPQRQALIALMVKHRSNESGLHRHLGSIPSQGASVFSIVGGAE